MSLYGIVFGKQGENEAANYLREKGFDIVAKNFRSKFGEIDIVAKKKDCLYFVEVKTRSNSKRGLPYEAVNKRKIFHMRQSAQYFLLKNKYKSYKLKLSVVSILKSEHRIDFFDNISL